MASPATVNKTTAAKGWRCPDCGRLFTLKTREHSCDLHTLEAHLQRASPDIQKVFLALQERLEALGPYRLVPLKTMVVLSGVRNFAGITLTRNKLDLGLFLPPGLVHPRLRKVEQLSPRRWAYHLHLFNVQEVDMEVGNWLQQAYRIGAAED
jgi:hypothetical protein